MQADPEKTRVLNELNAAAEEAAKIERALTEAQEVPLRTPERRRKERRAVADRRNGDRRSASGE